VIVQSRGSEPAPDWIFAILLHERRSVLRRLTNMETFTPDSMTVFKYRRNVGIRLAGCLAICPLLSVFVYRVCDGAPDVRLAGPAD